MSTRNYPDPERFSLVEFEARAQGHRYIVEFRDGLYGVDYLMTCNDPEALIVERCVELFDRHLHTWDLGEPLADFHPPLEYHAAFIEEVEPVSIEAWDRAFTRAGKQIDDEQLTGAQMHDTLDALSKALGTSLAALADFAESAQRAAERLELAGLELAIEFESNWLRRLVYRWRLFVRRNELEGRWLTNLGF